MFKITAERKPEINLISAYLNTKGYEHSIQGNEFKIKVPLDSLTVEIRAVIPEEFPFILPDFHLIDRLKMGRLAHVSWKPSDPQYADICYTNKNATNINFKDPTAVFSSALDSAIKTLSTCLNDSTTNDEELYREYMSVWGFFCETSLPILCLADPKPNDFVFLNIYSNSKRLIAASKHNSVNPNSVLSYKNLNLNKSITGKGFLISLECYIPLPAPLDNLMDWWQQQLAEIPKFLIEKINHQYHKEKARNFWIILHTVYKGNPFYIGLQFERKPEYQTITLTPPTSTQDLDKWSVIASQIRPISPDVLIPRSGGSTSWQDKHICVIGCGSVGSQVLNLMCTEGIGKLTIVDDDTLGLENIHKHTLSPLYLGTYKSDSLKFDLESRYPFVSIQSERTSLKGTNINNVLNWRNFDLIIWVTGNSTIEMKFNEYKLQQQLDVPVIYAWNEPYGVGGHAVLTLPEKPGCLACTYIDKSTLQLGLYSNLAFLKPGQKLLSETGGCGYDYIAFSATDAIQTSVQVIRLIQRYFNNQVEESIALSWKGDGHLADQRGLHFTRRYKKFDCTFKEIKIECEDCHACH